MATREYFSIFDTINTTAEERRRRHVFLLVNAVVLSWIIWCIVNWRNYAALNGSLLFREILVDFLENLVEVVALVELSIIYSKIIIRVFWNQNKTITRLFLQVFILSLLNALSSLAIGELYHVIYPEEQGILLRIFISDFFVVSVLTTTYFVSFLISRHRKEEEVRLLSEKREREQEIISMQTKLDNLALRTDNHFIFNSFSTLGGMIRTQPDDAEKFLQELSEMFRYLVRNGDRKIVSLREEISFTEHYVTLINYRYDGIRVSIDKSLRKINAYIFPVSIQQLVENAVKHNRHGENNLLTIEILSDGDSVEVRNNILELKAKPADGTGSGLKTLGERMRLLLGKKISVENDGKTFSVRVPLIYEEDLKDESLDY